MQRATPTPPQRGHLFSSPKSDHIKKLRSYFVKKNRQRDSRAIVEGVNAVETLVQRFPESVVELLISTDLTGSPWSKRILEIESVASQNGSLINKATSEVLNSISENSEGIIALAKLAVFQKDVQKSGPVVVCKDTSDPGNAGTLIRAAAALGASKVIFTGGSVDHWNPKVIRSSVGAVFQIAIQSIDTIERAVSFLKSSGYTVVALDGYGLPKNPARPLQEVHSSFFQERNDKKFCVKQDRFPQGNDPQPEIPRASQKIAYLFGNEAHGLSSEGLELADYIAKIEMAPDGVESLNLAGAVHICLYEHLVHSAAST